MTKAIKVFIVDNHDLIRLGIRHLLADVKNIEIIGEASSGEIAIDLVRELKPDIVIMDIKMPGIGGFEATRRLLKNNPKIKVLIITICEDYFLFSNVLSAGASGYISKDASAKEILEAIRSIYDGKRFISGKLIDKFYLDDASNASSPFSKLSMRELQVVMMIIRGHRAKEIGSKLNINHKTINTYRYRIHKKLRIKSDIELASLAMNYNLLNELG
jgi:two-component system, NarL family, invasion response regulator UvrY